MRAMFNRQNSGERSMPHNQHKPPDGMGEQRAANELVKLVRKLRWMGLEREAEKVENQLILRKAQADSVIAASHETD
jgi:hypothetical protein